MTYKLYEARKEHQLQKAPMMARSYINTYFMWLKSIQAVDVVDAIEQGTTIEKAYHDLGINPLRMGIAAARGFLKISKTSQAKLREIATVELTLMTLKYENPSTYEVIQRYGERGQLYIRQWIQGALKILGC
jgi:hypothetical protein